jgi:glycolate oxidase subunit GlcD
MKTDALIHDLGRIVGAEHVLEAAGHYLHDTTLTMGLRGEAEAVVRPGSTEEVAATVRHCYEHDVPIVPRGGGTGFAGGATPTQGGIVLSLERLARVRSFDPLLWRIEVEAGVRTHSVQRLARENGLAFPVDPGAAEESQIGGNIATNAGGPHCFKYGVMRAWVTGVEAVMAPGEIARFGGPVRKDVAGYDLLGLLCGSEGTLGIITAAWLRLIPAPPVSLAAAGFYSDAAAGQEAIEQLMASGVQPAAIEYLDAATLAICGATFPGGMPADAGFLVITEADTSEADFAELVEALGPGARTPDPRALWRWRDSVSLAVTVSRGGKLSDDIAVPVDRLAEAVERTVEIGRRHGLQACSWGHAGDGNLHSTFLLDPGEPAERRAANAAAEELFALAAELGGTISGEHGLGVLKNHKLSLQWSPAAVGAHDAVRGALDPKGLFNPGKKLA